MQRQFQAGAEGVGIEETMLSMQKAQIGFQAALAVRNRLVSAYTDIMNMSV
jgi:flagellar hook-basal body complex protein FliE